MNNQRKKSHTNPEPRRRWRPGHQAPCTATQACLCDARPLQQVLECRCYIADAPADRLQLRRSAVYENSLEQNLTEATLDTQVHTGAGTAEPITGRMNASGVLYFVVIRYAGVSVHTQPGATVAQRYWHVLQPSAPQVSPVVQSGATHTVGRSSGDALWPTHITEGLRSCCS